VIVTLTVGLFGVRELGLFGNPGCGLPIVTCTRVLFIGNSYTYVNDLPATFANLAWSGGYRVDTRTLASGGGTLAAHAADPETASVIGSEPWSTVVLQDQSQNPASASYRASEMYPAATDLVALIRNAGARPMFFLTWGHRSGWPEAGLPGYTSMQAAVDQGYLGIAVRLTVPVAPVGAAWQAVISAPGGPELWQQDGSHPTVSGTYLAACVFFAAIFHRTPVGLSYRSGLSTSEAATLQLVAASTALGGRRTWGLP
jgi:hypothetical protein